MNRALVYELATARFISQREDVLLLNPPGCRGRQPCDTTGGDGESRPTCVSSRYQKWPVLNCL
jgi:hypothetical protein